MGEVLCATVRSRGGKQTIVLAVVQKESRMSEEPKTTVSVSLELNPVLVARIENALKHLPPGWTVARVFEVGAEQLLQRLARKYNRGQPFPE
jgi:hypothetical protein